MATAKGVWKSLIKRFSIRGGKVNPVPLSLLSQYERKTGFVLPHSYCGFCKVFGPGEIDGGADFSICVPDANYQHLNLEYVNSMIRGRYITDLKDLDQFARSVFFGSNMDASYLFWDPQDVTNGEEKEYGIYVLHRDNSVERLSDSFLSFIHDHCMVVQPSEEYEYTFTPGS